MLILKHIKVAHVSGLLIIGLLVSSTLFSQSRERKLEGFHFGADLSMVKQIEDNGGQYFIGDDEVDVLQAFKDNDYEYVRLRLFHTPNGEMNMVNSLDYTLELAEHLKQKGLKLLLDFHYSDAWADPSQQTKPMAWQNLDFETLNDSLYAYTRFVLNRFNDRGIMPDIIQTGNEIHHGMLWNDGAIWNDGSSNWANFTTLLKSAIRGVRESINGQDIPIMVHGVYSTDTQKARSFVDSLEVYNVEFDILGLSYYICWDGGLQGLDDNLSFLNSNYDYDIILAETNYNSDGTTPDWCVIDDSDLPFPFTEQGQYDYVKNLYGILKKYSKIKAMYYWGGELIWADEVGGAYYSLFHWQGPARKAFFAIADMNPFGLREDFILNKYEILVTKDNVLKIKDVGLNNSIKNVSIYNIYGVVVFRENTKKNSYSKDLSYLDDGFYFVELSTEYGNTVRKIHLIKE